jgi:hypothetical protein
VEVAAPNRKSGSTVALPRPESTGGSSAEASWGRARAFPLPFPLGSSVSAIELLVDARRGLAGCVTEAVGGFDAG